MSESCYESEYLVTATVEFRVFADSQADAEEAVSAGLHRTITVPALMGSGMANIAGTEAKVCSELLGPAEQSEKG